jgi:hypothetical protein
MKISKKNQTIKIITICAAQLAMILSIVLVLVGVTKDAALLKIILGILSMASVLYLGLIGFGSVVTEAENEKLNQRVDELTETVTRFDDAVIEINQRNDKNSQIMKQATQGIAGSLELLMEKIKMITEPPVQPEEPQKGKKR